MPKLGLLATFASMFALCLVSPSSAQIKTLVSFHGTDGANPGYGSLIQGTDGSLYGTTMYGGSLYGGSYGCPNPYGCGTVFGVAPAGSLSTLASFAPNGGPGIPENGVIQANDGNFYGTTIDGGANDCGTVFKMTKQGTVSTLFSFDCALDGASPEGGLLQATNGFLYGTTSSGGAYSGGTIFKISTSGVFTTVYNFCSAGDGCTDGSNPVTSLIQGSDGNLYGTTLHGDFEMGTVFRMTLAGKLTTIYAFCSEGHCLDGNTPQSALIEGPDGNYYGTTVGGGQNGAGTVYKISPSGELTTLHSFAGSDGGQPTGSLVYASDGNFYGTTSAGWTYNGTVFKMTPGGELTTLYNFCSQQYCEDGSVPYAGLVQHTDGTLYGTTNLSGDNSCETISSGCGTVYALTAHLPAFLESRPMLDTPGSHVILLGTGISDATSVTFNGTPAQFTVISSTEIRATVPPGATTGKIKVTLSGRSLSTILNFTVK